MPALPPVSAGVPPPTAGQRRGLASAAAILAAAFLASRVLGVVKWTVIGATVQPAPAPDLNAFLTAFKVPDLIFLLLSGGALSSALVPTLAGYLAHDEEEQAWRTASSVFNALALLLIAAVAVAFLLAPLYSPWLLDRQQGDPQAVALTVRLTRIMLLQPFCLALASVLMGAANAAHRFAIPALAPLLYNVVFIVGALLAPRFGVEAVAWGVSLGGLAQLGLQVAGLGAQRRWYRPVIAWADAGVREIMRLMGPRLFGQVGLQLTLIVTTKLANSLPRAANDVLNFAFTLVTLPVGIFAASLAVAAFPGMSQQAARGEHAALRTSVSLTLRRVLFLTVPSAVGLALLAPHVVAVLFGHGQFGRDPVNLTMTSTALLLYAVGLPAHAAVEVLPRAFFALRDTRTPVVINLCTLALAIVLSIVLVRVLPPEAAYSGLALALSLSVIVEALWLTALLRDRLDGLEGINLATSLGRALLAAGAMEVVLLFVLAVGEPRLPPGWLTADLPLTVLGVATGVATYLAVARLLGAQEVQVAMGMLRRRF